MIEDSDGDSNDEESGLPSADECLQLCKTFADFTETDNALAMMFLQQHSWNLEVCPLCLKSNG